MKLGRLALCLLPAAIAVACAAGEDPDKSSVTVSSGAQTSSASAGGHGATGVGGSGGAPGPCAMDCSAISTPPCLKSVCNEGMYQGVIGDCVIVPDEGASCNDGEFCTIDDTCDDNGQCQGGPPNDCGMTASQCNEIACDEDADSCGEVPAMNGGPCQDPNNLCIKGSTCNNGQCIGGQLDDCFFFPVPDDCHVAVCNPTNGMCEAQVGNEGLGCVDPLDLCTVNKTCLTGVCQGGVPKDCSGLTMGCVLGVCDTANGQCTTQAVMNGDPCDDLNPCTTGELCNSGNCNGGVPVTQCVSNDNCCPTGCDITNDADCGIFDLDIGAHSSIFSSTLTRGFWFQAPVTFTIKELRVPLEVGNDVQNIQVVKFTTGPPPDYSLTTTAFQTLALYQGVPGTAYIPINVVVQMGDYIGILGARGTTTMSNSYAATYFYNTTIFSQPVVLHRLIYQGVLYSTPAGPLSNENGGSYGRVEMKYGP